eukprot:11933921-Heterocapsa_arctica.AAC.1
MSGLGLSGTAFEEPGNLLCKKPRKTYRITKEWRMEWMRTSPESITSSSLRQKPMGAGALHTMLADGVWSPDRAEKRRNNADGLIVLCGAPCAGVEHIWRECPALNG